MSAEKRNPMTVFGWCAGPNDQFHSLCRRSYTTAMGVQRVCSCPAHDNDPETED